MLYFPFWSSGQSFEQIFLQNSFIWKCDCKTSHSTTVPVCIIHTYRCLLLWFPMHGRSTYSKLADSFSWFWFKTLTACSLAFLQETNMEQNTCCMWTCNNATRGECHHCMLFQVLHLQSVHFEVHLYFTGWFVSHQNWLSRSQILMCSSLARVLKNSNIIIFPKNYSRSFMEVAKKPRRTRTILDRIGWVTSVLLNQK